MRWAKARQFDRRAVWLNLALARSVVAIPDEGVGSAEATTVVTFGAQELRDSTEYSLIFEQPEDLIGRTGSKA